jgi:hypothetical protein
MSNIIVIEDKDGLVKLVVRDSVAHKEELKTPITYAKMYPLFKKEELNFSTNSAQQYMNELKDNPASFELHEPKEEMTSNKGSFSNYDEPKDVLNCIKTLKELEKEDEEFRPILKHDRAYLPNKKGYDLVEYIAIQSSNIAKIGFTTDSNVLIEFNNGTEYIYDNVSKEDFDKIRDAESVGSHFHKEFKGKYKYTKIENK